MSTFIPKIQKGDYKSGLSGVQLCAMQAVVAKLTGAAAQEQGRQLWGNVTSAVHALTSQMETEAALEATRRFFADTRAAMRSQAIAKAVADAGYGEWDQLVVSGDDKEGLPAEAGRRAAALYGAKIKFGKILDKAETTVKQYEANILNAISLGVEFAGKGLSKLARECKDAADALHPERIEARKLDNEVSGRGADLASTFKANSDDQEAVSMFNAFGLVMRAWKRLDDMTKEHVLETLNLTASIAADVVAAMEAELKEAEVDKTIDEAPAVKAETVDALRDLNDDNAPVDEREPIAA